MDEVKINSIGRLSEAARRAILSGECKCTKADMERMCKFGDRNMAKLSRKIEKGEVLEVFHAIEALSKSAVPNAGSEISAKELAEKSESVLDRIVGLSFVERFKEFSRSHGWEGTIEEQEVIDSWNELERAWRGFRNYAKRVTGDQKCGIRKFSR